PGVQSVTSGIRPPKAPCYAIARRATIQPARHERGNRMRTSAIRWSEFFLLLALLAWIAGCQKRPPRPPVATGPPAPLDGLRQLEREQAEQLVRADPAVQKLLGTG